MNIEQGQQYDLVFEAYIQRVDSGIPHENVK